MALGFTFDHYFVMTSRPSIPKGTRDFTSEEMLKRDHIFDTIRDVFRLYGYQPIETPAMENLTTLLGKYGEEGDKLIFRILNSGDFLASVSEDDIKSRNQSKLSSKFCEKGLRYDLTVPFARYVVQHRGEITFPFRRYQIQPVWRADRPQKGRYREFFQCDADVIGSDSLLNEYELIRIIDDVFAKLRIPVTIKINNRKILAGIADYIGEPERITDITVALDKIDKIGTEAVNEEMKMKGVSEASVKKLKPVMELKGTTADKLYALENILSTSVEGMKGISELRTLFGYIDNGHPDSVTELDMTLVRGLNYYTGAIIEVKANDVNIGSICGGGRYDNLTGIFGLEGVSGVGVSFGADRIFDVLSQLELFGDIEAKGTRILVLNFGEAEIGYSLKILDLIRKCGISSELYPDPLKLKKQMSYADSRNIPYIVIAGDAEIMNNKVTVKVMKTGLQKKLSLAEFEAVLKSGPDGLQQ